MVAKMINAIGNVILVCTVIFAVSTNSLPTQEEQLPPIIDIAPIIKPQDYQTVEIIETRRQIFEASQKWGFYHVINHGVDLDLLSSLETEIHSFFSLPSQVKSGIKRTANNSRGFADDELTKQILDTKELLDIGPIEEFDATKLSEQAKKDALIDGVNFWPDSEILPSFKTKISEYYSTCYNLSMVLIDNIASYLPCSGNSSELFRYAFDQHSSFLRLNFYPIKNRESACLNSGNNDDSGQCGNQDISRLGISRHTDAGALTILWQDSQNALQVYSGSKEDFNDGKWIPVNPPANSLTINSGDMLQVWTNDIFKAPEHRVLASTNAVRYSAAFFLNPSYDTLVSPLNCQVGDNQETLSALYRPIRWGYFRTMRFRGDYEDIGEEIQIEKYRVAN